jgi:uncharacterized protein YdhG (YjbR/CyaY superfamily)
MKKILLSIIMLAVFGSSILLIVYTNKKEAERVEKEKQTICKEKWVEEREKCKLGMLKDEGYNELEIDCRACHELRDPSSWKEKNYYYDSSTREKKWHEGYEECVICDINDRYTFEVKAVSKCEKELDLKYSNKELPPEMTCWKGGFLDWAKSLAAKPVIYLYPEQKQEVKVQLYYQGRIVADYPDYDEKINGWIVTAHPDGKIINHGDNKEYSYLFWEGEREGQDYWDLSKGFIVKGEDTKEFLQEILSKIGLTPKEYNEFVVYWFPLMQNNKYNLIHFADQQYTDIAPLVITPEPDSILRVFMVYQALEEPIEIEKQEIEPFERTGFTVIEWGGTEIK